VDITTVADDLIVAHDGLTVHRLEGLAPGTVHDVAGVVVRTLDRPPGELLYRFATVNDVHFGELECGRIDDHPDGPIQRAAPGEQPYPETMNRAAAAEIRASAIDTLVVKGDLSVDGQPHEWAAFEDCYRTAFGDGLHVVRGNHDSYHGQDEYAGDRWIELPGVAIALMDTTIPHHTTGHLDDAQLDWLDAHAATADRPVIVMGHHQQWTDGKRSDGFEVFGGVTHVERALIVAASQRAPRPGSRSAYAARSRGSASSSRLTRHRSFAAWRPYPRCRSTNSSSET
jgi:predicted phosphodiesterase